MTKYNIIHTRTAFIYLIALFTIPLSGICIDLYTPSLPAITAYFHTEKAYVQLTISAYLIGFSLFHLVAGPLVDGLGRRIPLIFALLLNAIIALAIPYLSSIYTFILVRILQGVAVAISSVAARSIVIDLYVHEKEIFLKKMSMCVIAWGIGPIIAPAVGGYIQHYLNWQANFYAMAIYLLIIGFGALFFVPETHAEFQSIHPKKILSKYATILKNKKFLAYSIICGPMWGCLVLFAIEGPFIIQTALKYSAVVFGNLALAAGLAWVVGSTIFRRMGGNLSIRSFYIIFLTALLLSTSMMITGLMGYFNLWLVAIPSILIICIAALIFTYCITHGLAIFPKEIGGSANAMSFSISSLGVMIISAIGATQQAHSQIPLGIMFFIIMLFVTAIFHLFLKK